jgi:hypothetical protein
MLIGIIAAVFLLPISAVAVLVYKINSNKLHLILLGLIIGLAALIKPLYMLFAKCREHPEVLYNGETGLVVSGIFFIGYLIFILVLSGILFLNVQTKGKSISKPLRIICRLPFIIGMSIFFIFFTGVFPFD